MKEVMKANKFYTGVLRPDVRGLPSEIKKCITSLNTVLCFYNFKNITKKYYKPLAHCK